MRDPLPSASTLNDLLPEAQRHGYAVPAFSARYLACVRPLVEAALERRAPFILEISQRELGWFDLTPEAFRDEVGRVVSDLEVDLPFALHLDHTFAEPLVVEAMDAGFTSVMIDASAEPFDVNVARTRALVEEAHGRGVSVEAELGRLTTTDRMEAEGGAAAYTDPEEARQFVDGSGCDALAVSVGTAHGVYPPAGPTIDFARLTAIRRAVGSTPIVLHGGSGLPADLVARAVRLPGGGISKMNIATDFEQALLGAMDHGERMTSAALDAVDPDVRARGLAAVRTVAVNKIELLLAAGRA
ncbi:MAG: class II fructose-bisphosphate aldolase [Euzebyaceae bacterium]|jgi:ketose-bisphosphate aldolase|nr:class II fructose-bisphosphate aldolase [Euzebyaceae bacterium]